MIITPIYGVFRTLALLFIAIHQCAFEFGNMDLVDEMENLIERFTIVCNAIVDALDTIKELAKVALFGFPSLATTLLRHLTGIKLGRFGRLSAKLRSLKWLQALGALGLTLPPILFFPGAFILLSVITAVLSPLSWLFEWLPLDALFLGIFPIIVYLLILGLTLESLLFFQV